MHPANHCFRFHEIRAAACATLLVALTAMPTPALAQNEPFAVRCKQWIEKKGYSLDYIEQRTGKRQPGQPPSWKGNVKPEAVQVGDVVISSVQGTEYRPPRPKPSPEPPRNVRPSRRPR